MNEDKFNMIERFFLIPVYPIIPVNFFSNSTRRKNSRESQAENAVR